MNLRTIEIEVDGRKRVLHLNLETKYLVIPMIGRFADSGRRTYEGYEIWEDAPYSSETVPASEPAPGP